MMESQWKECALGDIITFQRGYDLPKTKMSGHGYPVIGSNGVIGFHNEYTAEAPAVTIGRSGNVGNPFIFYGRAWCHNTSLFVKEFKGVDPVFAYYFLKTLDLGSYAGGSAVPTLNRNHIHSLSVRVPASLETQKRIGRFLKSLDDKITLNARINENLEQQADTIFYYEFFQCGTPFNSWKQSSLSEIANYLNGLAMQKFRPKKEEIGLPVLKIKELRQGFCDDNSELCSPNIKRDYLVHDGDVIFSWSGSLLVDFWCGGTCGLNQHLFKVTSKDYDKWFYYAWTKHHLKKFAGIASAMATTMGHIKREELTKASVLIPAHSDYTRIGALLTPLYDLIISNRIESNLLTALRDALLPRLMSGELDVSGIDP